MLSLSLSLSLVLPVVAEAHRAEQALATKAPEGEEETTGEGKRSEAIKKSPNRQKGRMEEEEGSPPGLDIATKETMTMGDQREEQDKAEGEEGKKKTLERLTMSTSSSGFSSEDEGCGGGKQVEGAAAMTDSDERVKASPEEEYSEECCDMKQSAPPLLSLRVKYLGRVDLVEKDFGNKKGKVTRSDILDTCVEELCRRQGKGKEEGEKKSERGLVGGEEEEDAKLELSRENIR